MQKEHLALAMDYAAAMEACASYCQVNTPSIRDPEAAYRILAPLAHAATQEVFWTLLLNTKSRLVAAPVEASRGLLDSCPVHPREVFRAAITTGAACVIVAHNHPSGDPTPSAEDIQITRRLVDASKLLGIRVTDHLICGRKTDTNPAGFISLREKNLVAFE